MVYDCDLDETKFLEETTFNFEAHRRIEHYRLIAKQTGAKPPPEDWVCTHKWRHQ